MKKKVKLGINTQTGDHRIVTKYMENELTKQVEDGIMIETDKTEMIGKTVMDKNALSRPKWDDWLMGMCFWVSLRSPDPSTKHGAILCNSQHQILGIGYNGFPRGCKDVELPLTRPEKYDIIIHAEENCLLNSQNLLLNSGYTMYITGFPCSRCFSKIIQCGIKKVVYGPLSSHCVQIDQIEIVGMLAKEANIHLQEYEGSFSCLKNIDLFRGTLSFSSE